MKPVEYLSFGGGPPSIALMVLNAWGEIQPKAELIVFADTGGEKAATYGLLPAYEDFAAEMSMEYVTVQAKEGPLREYVEDRSIPIPVHTENAIGKRQCTDKWKIAPIEQHLHRVYGKQTPLIAQLAMTWGEMHRVRDPRVARNRNRWPLIEKRLTRQHCIDIIKLAKLPVPPWSACYFCPLQNDARWREEAANGSDDFANAVSLDNYMRERAKSVGKSPVWLHWSHRPLGNVYSSDQLAFPLGTDGGLMDGCSGANCFT